MPLVRIDALEGRSAEQVSTLLEAVHRALVTAFHIPNRDRYQVYQEHRQGRLVLQDTGLGLVRTDKVVLISITSRPRAEADKLQLYTVLCRELESACGIEPRDVIVSLVTNTDADWSFGNGKAQFVTGEL
jgi:hypothetical protein